MKKTTKLSGRRFMTAMACALCLMAASCSSSEDEPKPQENDPEVTYKGNVAYSDGLVFNGNELGNGTQNTAIAIAIFSISFASSTPAALKNLFFTKHSFKLRNIKD